jgi:hypothetical protein
MQKPSVELTEISRVPMGVGFDLVTYNGVDGQKYAVQKRDDIESNWVRIPQGLEEDD